MSETASASSATDVTAAYFAAIDAHDLEAAAACWAPDGIDHLSGIADLSGPEGVRDYFATIFAAFPDFRFAEYDVLPIDERRTAVHWRATGTFAGPGSFQGLEPTGAHIDIGGVDLTTVEDGLIVRNDAYLNAAELARQLGALPPAGSGAEQRMTGALNLRTRLAGRLAAAPAETVADGVHLIRGGLTRMMNVYLIEHEGRVTVFDCGEKGMAPAIAAAAARLGGIERIVLGHADNDHRGAAPALGAPVWCHPLEVEAAEQAGYRDYWRQELLPPAVRMIHRFSMDHVWEGGPVAIAGTVTEGDEVAGFRVIELPGHAPGLIGLWRESDRLALVSDCFYMTTMWGRPQPPAAPVDAYNLDTAQAKRSIAKLAALDPAIVCPGHLGPLADDVRGALERAAAG